MQHVEAKQGIGIHEVPAEHEESNLAANHRHRGSNVRSDRDGPERQLIPGQQVSGIAEQQRDQQKNDANHPVELARRPIRSAVEHTEHVREDQEHHGVGRPAMQIAEKLPRGNHELQVLGIGICLRGRRVVVEHQQDSRDGENPEGAQSKCAQVPGRVELEHPLPHLGGKQVEEYVLLDRHRVVQSARSGAAAKHRAPDSRSAQFVEVFDKRCVHG